MIVEDIEDGVPLKTFEDKDGISPRKSHITHMSTEDRIIWTPPKLIKNQSFDSPTTKSLASLKNSLARSAKNSPARSGSSVEELVSVVEALYHEQQKINLVNLKLNTVNLFANFANVVNVSKLSQKCSDFEKDLDEEKKVVSRLSGTVHEQEGTINDLTNTVDGLKVEVTDQKEEIARTTHKYYTSLSQLEGTMSVHKQIIEKLQSSQLKEDFIVDFFMLLTSIYCVNTKLVHFPLRFLLSIVMLPPGTRFPLRMLLKMILALLMTYQCRRLAIREGFHASVGSLTQYIMKGASLLFFSNLKK
ncbi:2 TM domain-containing transmembrane protein [Acrasis kona]|uniref:2 TM domain-containing transmembrane protein n=1 Tax=Acrasis kona TaxID=1008807 RepID=A0AAW2ZCP5_9EUKA